MTSPSAAPARAASFGDLGVDRKLVDVLRRDTITTPTPVQALTIPDALQGLDVCGRAETGSGKTLAFGIPLIQRIGTAEKRRPKALILSPTRELAVQITETLRPLAKARSLWIAAVYGGQSMVPQVRRLHAGVDVLVATPGRLIDLLDRKELKLDDLEAVVIDEADQMADMGFLPQVTRILDQADDGHQTLLFSATLDGSVGELIERYQHDPVHHEVVADEPSVERMQHRFLGVERQDRTSVTASICASTQRTLVFVRTKHGADRLAKRLKNQDVAACSLHGGLSQAKRERILDGFKKGRTSVLVATDVAARGVHVDSVDAVVHFDPPEDDKVYVHRSGRTARAGEDGIVITLVLAEQRRKIDKMKRALGVSEDTITFRPDTDRIDTLVTFPPPRELPTHGNGDDNATREDERRQPSRRPASKSKHKSRNNYRKNDRKKPRRNPNGKPRNKSGHASAAKSGENSGGKTRNGSGNKTGQGGTKTSNGSGGNSGGKTGGNSGGKSKSNHKSRNNSGNKSNHKSRNNSSGHSGAKQTNKPRHRSRAKSAGN